LVVGAQRKVTMAEELSYRAEAAAEYDRAFSHVSAYFVPFLLCAARCVTIPVGTTFQFRAASDGPLAAIAIMMPPWPGEDEAEAEIVTGNWEPTV
jgi:hypothetical protein